MPPDDQTLLAAVARVVMDGSQGSLEQQLVRPATLIDTNDDVAARGGRPAEPPKEDKATAAPTNPGVTAFNGLGGFSPDGREYVIRVELRNGSVPPAPWSNVVAQPTFGFAASELGPGFTWSENSHDNRLTPWRNDPVRDAPGRGRVHPRRGQSTSVVGDCRCRREAVCPIPSATAAATPPTSTPVTASNRRLTLLVAPDAPVKLFQLSLRNTSGRARRLSVTLYVDWVLGEQRAKTQHARRHRPRAGNRRCRGDERLS